MIVTLVTPPASEPLALADVQAYRRIDTDDEANLIQFLITVARERCENFTARALLTQTWDLVRDHWPGRNVRGQYMPHPQPYPSAITVPLPNLQSVTSVKFYDVTGAEYVMDPGDYFVDGDSQPGRVALQYSRIWPTTVLRPANGIRVRFVAGYGDSADSVPKSLIQGMQLAVGHWYEHREEIGVARTSAAAFELPAATEALWWPYRSFTEESF